MGKVIIALGGAGGIDPDECTAGRPQVLSGYIAGIYGEDDPAPGSMPENGAWIRSVSMNESVTIPEGHHNGQGKINGPSVTQRGSWNGTVGMNTQINIPDGYHNGNGKVSGPSVVYQNADVSGTDRAYATGTSAWGGVMCLGVRNGHYLNGVNWIQADITGLQPRNIREGINIGGINGTLKDYSYLATGQTSFNMGTYLGVLANGFWEFNYPIQQFSDGSVKIPGSKYNTADRMVLSKKSIHLGPFGRVRIEFSPQLFRSETYSWIELVVGFFPKTCYDNGYTVIDRATGQSPTFKPYVDHYSDWNKNGVYSYELQIPDEYKKDFWFLGIQGGCSTNNRYTGLIALRKVEILN